ncbi:peroxiredoxin [Dyadobacter frigoris]|uniref:OsmC family peroxiredoxin n=1 Tax=Dyadobacter frigoris TaxID=2576211 RepID=UPI0024A4BB6C|nr:OsmC family peroxiredoxin [Dyadobacter frigoris]GLU55174.1 peroxiredoxin [Dyadobacter frigoris]
MKHSAIAIWTGTGKNGKGNVTTESLILKQVPYTLKSRFDDGYGTNPEELIAAAHASCFTMKLSFVVVEAGYIPVTLRTEAFIIMEHGFITGAQLVLLAQIGGITKETFDACVREAVSNCPVSNVLKVQTTIEAKLE